MFKRFAFLLLVLALALPVMAQDDGITITVAGWSSNPAEDAALTERLAEFMEANPDITVNFVPSTDHNVTMQTAFASGTYPEVFYIDSSRLPDWATAGVVSIGDDQIADPEGFYAPLLDVFTFEGDLYCPPKDFSTMALQYNKDLFDAAGLEYPTAEWTWDDLYAAAEALTDAEDGVIGLVTPPNLERWLPFLYQNGGAIFNEDGEYVMDDELAIEALDFYISFASNGVGGTPSAVDSGWGGEAFGRGRAAMAMEGNWVIQFLLDNYPELNWGVAELPMGEAGQATMAFTVCYGVAANVEGDVAEAAWQVVNFLTDDDGAATVASASFGPMPTRPSAAEAYLANWEARTEGSGVDFNDFSAYIAGGDYSYPWVLPVGFQPFVDAFNAGLQRGFDGQATAEDILFEAAAVAEELMEE
ncbi:MAG: ABC transporter substrate-binding protein [Anaerolineae bacterium]|jgi:multiple sugar transport system substrate-binding protein|nr:ABC transporter substrate-binding protein [Anaerolineae bacterium]